MEMKLLSYTNKMQMFDSISHVTPKPGDHPSVRDTPSKGKPTFLEFLQDNLKEVNSTGLDADRQMQNTIDGTQANPHATMIALQKADISFRLMMTVKEQLIQAYQQLVRTPIG